jgi:FdhD protein
MMTRKYKGYLANSQGQKLVEDDLCIEQPLRLQINGEPLSITMCSPGEEEFLLRGLMWGEDIFKVKTPHPSFEITEASDDIPKTINAIIPPEMVGKGIVNSRQLLSVASCGICGRQDFLPPRAGALKTDNELCLEASWIHGLYEKMEKFQEGFRKAGGSHAAAIFNRDGNMLALSEDIGRHNAVDKAVGKLLFDECLGDASYLLVSGRISYEIVAKCFSAGVPVLASISAPSSLSVDFALELGIHLLAFCRDDRFTLYSTDQLA